MCIVDMETATGLPNNKIFQMINKLKKRIERRAPVNDALWIELQEHSKVMHFKKNEVLINYSSIHKYVYFVVSGSFISTLVLENGVEQAVWFYLEDIFEFALCMDSYYLDEPTKYEIRALEDSTVIKFNKQIIDSWVLKYPSFNEFYRCDIIFDFIRTQEISAYRLVHTPLDFIKYLQNKYSLLISRISSKDMAYFTGISPEWYCKLKKKWSLELVQEVSLIYRLILLHYSQIKHFKMTDKINELKAKFNNSLDSAKQKVNQAQENAKASSENLKSSVEEKVNQAKMSFAEAQENAKEKKASVEESIVEFKAEHNVKKAKKKSRTC